MTDQYLSGMWNRQGFSRDTDRTAEDVVVAHGMVQTFVNAFAHDGVYKVSFSDTIQTAGTDLKAKNVVITSAPVLDPNLTAEDAGQVLTGMAVHEISHARYGKRTANAVRKAFPYNRFADSISNILDDVRIERRFARDYPGYAGVFEPTLEYVAKDGVILDAAASNYNIAVSALRYDRFTTWAPELAEEREWWMDWGDRWSEEDSPKKHVEAIREALQHVANRQQPEQPQRPKGTGEGGTGSDEQPEAEEPQGESQEMSDGEANQKTQTESTSSEHPDSCLDADNVKGASSADDYDIQTTDNDADQMVESARNLGDDGKGHKIDVATSTKGIVRDAYNPGTSDAAARAIRSVIVRSRGGNENIANAQKRGRLDNRRLDRVPMGSRNVFEKRTAPSPKAYNVMILADVSGSMAGIEIAQAAQVAHAIASGLKDTPSIRASVWAYSDAFRRSMAWDGVAKLWETGMKAAEIFKMTGLKNGGTPTGQVIGWATKKMVADSRLNETPVIIVLTDGTGSGNTAKRVEEARAKGVQVVGVSFGRAMAAEDLERDYGKGNYIEFNGSIETMARPLAQLFGTLLRRSARRAA